MYFSVKKRKITPKIKLFYCSDFQEQLENGVYGYGLIFHQLMIREVSNVLLEVAGLASLNYYHFNLETLSRLLSVCSGVYAAVYFDCHVVRHGKKSASMLNGTKQDESVFSNAFKYYPMRYVFVS